MRMVAYAHGQVRAVTHYGMTAADIDRTIVAVDAALRETAPSRRVIRDSAADPARGSGSDALSR